MQNRKEIFGEIDFQYVRNLPGSHEFSRSSNARESSFSFAVPVTVENERRFEQRREMLVENPMDHAVRIWGNRDFATFRIEKHELAVRSESVGSGEYRFADFLKALEEPSTEPSGFETETFPFRRFRMGTMEAL